ncbi:hypothetical protein ABW19_dt0210058 [Dactylella cylindrospora]|nr:hypothetical protein ABW19_dt0210058 [Dactylella cylindrospora]
MSHDHSSMNMDGTTDSSDASTTSSSHGSGDIMPVVFQWVLQTPLFSNAFTPQNGGQYIGALIFLMVLGIIWRAIASFKSYKEAKWKQLERSRKLIIAGGLDDKTSGEISTREIRSIAPWRWQVDAVRASLSFVSHGLGYLLMLAVMSLNVGYFFAILVGIFLGDLAFGRYGH